MWKKLRKVIAGFFVFLLATLAFFSFEEAIFNPLVNWMVALGGSPYTYWLILVISCMMLVYVFRRELPFTG